MLTIDRVFIVVVDKRILAAYVGNDAERKEAIRLARSFQGVVVSLPIEEDARRGSDNDGRTSH